VIVQVMTGACLLVCCDRAVGHVWFVVGLLYSLEDKFVRLGLFSSFMYFICSHLSVSQWSLGIANNASAPAVFPP